MIILIGLFLMRRKYSVIKMLHGPSDCAAIYNLFQGAATEVQINLYYRVISVSLVEYLL
jgi:hypothetical protein